MKMYKWESEALRDCLNKYDSGCGYIVVCAENVKDARKKVRECVEAEVKDIFGYYDDDDIESIEDKISEIMSDISNKPKIIKTSVFMMSAFEDLRG